MYRDQALAAQKRNQGDRSTLDGFLRVRALSLELAESLSDADAAVQSMEDASPAKWHLAHTTWFFETFVLRDFVPDYVPFDARYGFLFNSYYEAEGDRMARPLRGLMTRPSLADVRRYRHHVDDAIEGAFDDMPPQARELIVLGCQHEQQHQELLLMDILHLFAQNPLAPILWSAPVEAAITAPAPDAVGWVEGRTGAQTIGHAGHGFAFDCEGPAHTVWLAPHALADRLVTNAEWLAFMEDSAYARPSLWLSDGWAWVRKNAVSAPLYWRQDAAGAWSSEFGLNGLVPLEPAAPVQHVSYYEADAYARWAGARLPTEAEWESAAVGRQPDAGRFLDGPGLVRTAPAGPGSGLRQLFGDCWEWTASAFLPHPSFRPVEGAVGEYNGKFMSGQFVLKGGSCATPRFHVRASYRNFFYPHQRWQFAGLRLAKDL